MLTYVVRFFQRYANFFAVVAGIVARRLLLPHDAPWWLELAVLFAVGGAVYWLLYKDGVTGERADGKPGLTVLAIIGISLGYWYLAVFVLLLTAVGHCLPDDGLPLGQCIAGQTGFLIISTWVAALIYAFGLWWVIRGRRRPAY